LGQLFEGITTAVVGHGIVLMRTHQDRAMRLLAVIDVYTRE